MMERHTPCDFPDEYGEYHCPYADTYMGYEDEMCRNCCGIGVSEEEDYSESLLSDDVM